MRSITCNPQLVAVCNHFEEMYVIHRRWYVINPKEDTPAVMPYTLRVITYQSFGLDKKIDRSKPVDFFGGDYRARTCDPLLVRQMLSQLS